MASEPDVVAVCDFCGATAGDHWRCAYGSCCEAGLAAKKVSGWSHDNASWSFVAVVPVKAVIDALLELGDKEPWALPAAAFLQGRFE